MQSHFRTRRRTIETHVGDGTPESQLRQTDTLHGTWSDESIRRDWAHRETRRIIESDLRRFDANRTELSNLEFRRLAAFIFAEFPSLRREALLTGEITMGDGRVVRRKRHTDQRKRAA